MSHTKILIPTPPIFNTFFIAMLSTEQAKQKTSQKQGGGYE